MLSKWFNLKLPEMDTQQAADVKMFVFFVFGIVYLHVHF